VYKLVKPLLFLFQPETIHDIIIGLLKVLRYVPRAVWTLKKCFSCKNKSLEVKVLGLTFPNPIGLAAGFDKNAEVVNELAAFGFGFVEVGSVTPLPQPGNPKPRCFRLPKDKAIINRMGFNNLGAEKVAKNLHSRKSRVVVGGNIGKNTLTPNELAAEDYKKSFVALYPHADYFVVNVSCPNVASLCKLQDSEHLTEIVRGLTAHRSAQQQRKPILLKLSPDLTSAQVDEALEVVKNEGLDGVVATNTTTRRNGLQTSEKEVTKVGNGGLSGAPLTQRSLEMVRYISQKTNGQLPIIGVGGVMTEQDALNMLEAGASLVQIYSGFIFQGPAFAKRICRAILRRK
jgi:dihydroorotate dehydrogenase